MGAAATHLVSVFAHHGRLVLGQLAVAEKSNEIPEPWVYTALAAARTKCRFHCSARHSR